MDCIQENNNWTAFYCQVHLSKYINCRAEHKARIIASPLIQSFYNFEMDELLVVNQNRQKTYIFFTSFSTQ